MSRVICRNRRAISLPNTMATGVSNSNAHASRASNQCINKNAPQSCIAVIAIWGRVSVHTVLTCSISFANRDVTSPECKSSPSKSCRRNRLLKKNSLSLFICRILATVVSQNPTCRNTTPPTTVTTSHTTIRNTSSTLPMRIVTSMKRLLSHTISRPSNTCPIPATMRTTILQRMPRVLCHSHNTYLTSQESLSDRHPATFAASQPHPFGLRRLEHHIPHRVLL